MDDIEKSRIRLRHWIDHNSDHLKGYREVAEILSTVGEEQAAQSIMRGIDLMELAHKEFEQALKHLPGEDRPHGHSYDADSTTGDHSHGHHEHHHHEHEH